MKAALHLAHLLLVLASTGDPVLSPTCLTPRYEWRVTPNAQYALMRDGVQVGVWNRGRYLPRLGPGRFGEPTMLPEGVRSPERVMTKVP